MSLSERSPEPRQYDRSRALPVGGLIRPVSAPSKGRRKPDGRARTFSVRVEKQPPKITSGEPPEPMLDPLYLFACALSWHRHSDTNAGWELVRFLRSSGETVRIAAALLAHAEDFRPPVPTLARATDGPGKPSQQNELGLQKSAGRWL